MKLFPLITYTIAVVAAAGVEPNEETLVSGATGTVGSIRPNRAEVRRMCRGEQEARDETYGYHLESLDDHPCSFLRFRILPFLARGCAAIQSRTTQAEFWERELHMSSSKKGGSSKKGSSSKKGGSRKRNLEEDEVRHCAFLSV